MTAFGGVVLVGADQDKAVFLASTDLTMLEQTLDAIVRRPTVAGETPDLTGLERLAQAIELAREDSTATILSPIEEAGLELVKNQAALRAGLPVRIRHTCRACGHAQITNPARSPSPAPASNSGFGDAVAESIDLLSDGHPILATLNLFVSGSASEGDAPKQPQLVCGLCDGEEFSSAFVTVCLGCRAIRDESILFTCPECEFDYLSRTTGDEFWVSPERAAADAALARNVALLQEKAAGFENNLWPGQLRALTGMLRADEQLVGMCRCGLPGEVGRYVALLLTSQQLVWVRESARSAVTGGNVAWPDVRDVRPYLGTGSTTDKGVQLSTGDGAPLVFNDFRGKGVTFDVEPEGFTVESVYLTVNRLWRPDQPIAVTMATTVEPQTSEFPAIEAAIPVGLPASQPTAAPAPGWYPDPWQVARWRWWNGAQWTAYLTP